MSVLKYDPDSGQLTRLPYQLTSDFLAGEYVESIKYYYLFILLCWFRNGI